MPSSAARALLLEERGRPGIDRVIRAEELGMLRDQVKTGQNGPQEMRGLVIGEDGVTIACNR